ncbi:MAG: hypothetical protein ACXVFK_12530 [Solirubrobacteraceae bacterium]
MPDVDAGALLHQLTEPLRREIALAQELLERERKLQHEVTGQLVAPVDAVFDLLQETGSMLERQAAALEAAGAALSETAALVKGQAALFERTVGSLRRPVDLAKSAARLDKKKKPAPRRSSTRRRAG